MSPKRPTRSILPQCALAALTCVLAFAPPAAAQIRYPRLGLPGAIHGNGVPYLDSLGALDPNVIDIVSRYDQVILDVSPVTEYHPEILAALRARNPNITMLAYALGEDCWDVNDADSLVHFPTRYNHLVRNLGGYLYNRSGGYYAPTRVNIAKRVNGRYVVAEAIAQLFYDTVVSTGFWDGMFVDVYCDQISWSQAPTESIDVARAGYSSLATLDAAWKAGSDTLASRLRALSGPNFILVGNCAVGSKYAWFNGWTRENFPYQAGGNWDENMFRDPGGFFVDEARFRAPTHNQIFTTVQGSNQYDANNARKVRFGLASAALGTGFATFGPADRSFQTPPHDTWWYDEYAVDVASGQSVADRAHTGWLGAPLGGPYQLIWIGPNPDASTNPGFETDVTSGWTFGTFPPAVATLARDATTSGAGSASAHIHIATAGTLNWHVSLTTVATITVVPYAAYSATFWARASAPRTVTMAAVYGSGNGGGSRDFTIGTTWKRYQIVYIPTAGGSGSLAFFLGTQAGDVWFDDVHFQQGTTNLWRRDFDNGMVLVNPSDVTLQVPLGGTWRRIHGSVDPFVNDGSSITTASVPPGDALFLITSTTDLSPPAAIKDLHVQP